MRTAIHPDYHDVVYQDSSTGDAFLTRSTEKSW
jgi:large subunit ribosomal protein L31